MAGEVRRRAAIYCRVSTPKQAKDKPGGLRDAKQETSLEDQEARCRELAAARGYVVDEQYVFREVHTGAELWTRPLVTQLRELIRYHRVDVIVTLCLDRLSREPAHQFIIIEEAAHHGTPIEFVLEPTDDSTEGQALRMLKGIFAKFEREKLKERTMRGTLARAKAGKLLHAPRPLFGYRWTDEAHSSYTIEPSTAAVVQRIYSEVLAGKSLRQTIVGLNSDGVLTPMGRQWDTGSLRFLLRNPAYTGQASAMRTRTTRENGVRKVEKVPDEEQIPLPDHAVPAIIDRATFDGVQERLRHNQVASQRNCHDPERFLVRAGHVFCGICGRIAIVVGGDERHPSMYRCNSYARLACCHKPLPSANAAKVDAAVWRRIEYIMEHPEIIRQEIESRQAKDPTEADTKSMDRSLLAIARKQTNLARALANINDQDVAAPLLRELSALAEQQRHLETERLMLLQRQQGWVHAQATLRDLEAWCHHVAGKLNAMDYQRKRQLLYALRVRVEIFPHGRKPRYDIIMAVPLDPDNSIVGSSGGSSAPKRITLHWSGPDPAQYFATTVVTSY